MRAFVRFQTGWATSGERSVFGHDSARRPVRVPCTQRSRVRLRWVVLIVLTLFIVDGLRPPASQLSAIIYLRLVRQYQLYVTRHFRVESIAALHQVVQLIHLKQYAGTASFVAVSLRSGGLLSAIHGRDPIHPTRLHRLPSGRQTMIAPCITLPRRIERFG